MTELCQGPDPRPRKPRFDVPAGAIVATVPQGESSGDSSGDIHWSADSKSFDVISDVRGITEKLDKAGRQVLYNMYPSVRTWKVADIRNR